MLYTYMYNLGVKPMRTDDHVTGNYEDEVDGGAYGNCAQPFQHTHLGCSSCDDNVNGTGAGVLNTNVESSRECASAGALPSLIVLTQRTTD